MHQVPGLVLLLKDKMPNTIHLSKDNKSALDLIPTDILRAAVLLEAREGHSSIVWENLNMRLRLNKCQLGHFVFFGDDRGGSSAKVGPTTFQPQEITAYLECFR